MDEANAAGDLFGLLASAEQAGPVHRIEWRDRIAGYGGPAIDAMAPWLAEPTLAAFAIRVIERAGHDGEREAALLVLRGARRGIDPRVRPDLDWALLHLRATAPTKVAATPREARPVRVVRAERPYGVGRAAGTSRRSVQVHRSDPQ